MLLIDDRASARHSAAMLVAAQAELNGLRAQEQEQRDSVAAAATAQPAGASAPASGARWSVPSNELLSHFETRLCGSGIAPAACREAVEILRQSYAQEMCERGLDDLLAHPLAPKAPRC